MILCDKGKLSVRGGKAQVKTELTVIVKGLVEEGMFTDEEVDDAIRMARMSLEELADDLFGAVEKSLGMNGLSELLELFEKKLKSEEDSS